MIRMMKDIVWLLIDFVTGIIMTIGIVVFIIGWKLCSRGFKGHIIAEILMKSIIIEGKKMDEYNKPLG